MSEIELLTAADVGRLLKCSRSQVYKMRKSSILPRPVQVFPGERGARWLRQDVLDFILKLQSDSASSNPAQRPFVPLKLETS